MCGKTLLKDTEYRNTLKLLWFFLAYYHNDDTVWKHELQLTLEPYSSCTDIVRAFYTDFSLDTIGLRLERVKPLKLVVYPAQFPIKFKAYVLALTRKDDLVSYYLLFCMYKHEICIYNI